MATHVFPLTGPETSDVLADIASDRLSVVRRANGTDHGPRLPTQPAGARWWHALAVAGHLTPPISTGPWQLTPTGSRIAADRLTARTRAA